LMRIRKIVSSSTLGAFIAALAIGCQGSDVEGVGATLCLSLFQSGASP